MKYLKNLFLSLKEIFIMIILQYVILILSILIIGIEKSIIWGTVLLMIFELIYIIWKLTNSNFNFKVTLKNIYNKSYFPYFLIGIGICSIYNMIIFKFGLENEITTDFPIILNILCSGIVGPIFEEMLFRYDFINRLEKFNTNKYIIILLSGIIFGLMHTGITTIIYAMIVGIINAYIYINDKDIFKPITVHITCNIFVNFLYSYNPLILILGIILTVLGVLIIRNND